MAVTATRLSVCFWTAAVASAGLLDSLRHKDITPPVKIAQGEVTGRVRTTAAGTKFLSFQGIPYARPPVGDLRFQAPQPPDPWTGVLEAHSEGKVCPQKMSASMPSPKARSFSGVMKIMASVPKATKFAVSRLLLQELTENCLYLNVYTPAESLPVDKLIPVLFVIHGGAFQMGSGDEYTYGPDYLMDKGIVLVTINYRLGAIGFLSTNTSDAPGNAGMKDQVAALRWVRDNIKAFGGDPNMVTLYGESAGSAAVHLHIMSPMSKGLFHGAILSSSLAQTSYVMSRFMGNRTQQLAEDLGAGPETLADTKRRVQFLRDQPIKAIVEKTTPWPVVEAGPHALSQVDFTPVVEPEGPDAFLTEHPDDILLKGHFNNVPMIIGSNDKEGSLFFLRNNMDEALPRLNNAIETILPDTIYDSLTPEKRKEVALRVKEFYLGNDSVSMDSLGAVLNAIGDGMMLYGIHVGAHWHMKHAKPDSPVFLYHFTKDALGVGASFLIGAPPLNGSGHGDDLSYVFKNNVLSELATPNREMFVRGLAQMTEIVSNFVKTRNPVPIKTDTLNSDWPTATLPEKQYLEIGDELKVKQRLLEDRMNFWQEIFRSTVDRPIYNLT